MADVFDEYADLGSGVQGLLTGQQTVAQVLQQMDSDWTTAP